MDRLWRIQMFGDLWAAGGEQMDSGARSAPDGFPILPIIGRGLIPERSCGISVLQGYRVQKNDEENR